MPVFRIVYIDDDTFAPRTLTAGFASRAAAEVAMAKHGHRVVHIVELRAGERAADPIEVPIAMGEARDSGEALHASARATRPMLGWPRYDLAGAAVVAVGFAIAGAAFLLL
jgi:hypothetical protein